MNFDCDNTLHERRRTWIQNPREFIYKYNIKHIWMKFIIMIVYLPVDVAILQS
jgi:hypothetical protein